MNRQSPDQDMLEGFLEGNVEAFTRLHTALKGQLFYFAVKISGSEDLAADLVAESFIKLWEKKPSFETMAAMKAWLFRVIQNSALNVHASQVRHDASHQEMGRLLGTAESIEQTIIRSEALQAIYDQISRLPGQCRLVVEASFIEGKTTRQIAKEMKLAEQTVINQKNRGIKLVKSTLIKNGILSVAVVTAALILLDKKIF